MRSLHVITSTQGRGAETFALQLVESLRSRAGQEAELVALTDAPGSSLDVEPLGSHRRSPAMLRQLGMRARSVEVVVGHGSATLEACAIALLGSRVPFVFRTIGDPRYWVRSQVKRASVSTLLRRAHGHVVLWPRAAEDLVRLHGIDSSAISVIPNAVDGRRFPRASDEDRSKARRDLGLPPASPVLAYVGALTAEKNPQAIIDTASRLPEAKVVVVGHGPEVQRFMRAAPSLPNLLLIGSVDDPRAVYAAADYLLLPSFSEGMPGVVIEAGMVGTQTIAAAVGAVPSMLAGGRGILVDSSEPHAFIEACALALKLPQRAETSYWKRFDIGTVCEAWTEVLERVARGPKRHRRSGM